MKKKQTKAKDAAVENKIAPEESKQQTDGRKNQSIAREYLDLLIKFAVLAVVAWVMLTQVFMLTRAAGQGMFPSIKDGDLLIAYRLQKDFHKKDVVVYEVDGVQYVGRILGLASDFITIDESGSVLVNGTAQGGEILYPTYVTGDLTYPYEIPADSVFVLGDYRTQTKDSRELGPIPIENIKGKVLTVMRRRNI